MFFFRARSKKVLDQGALVQNISTSIQCTRSWNEVGIEACVSIFLGIKKTFDSVKCSLRLSLEDLAALLDKDGSCYQDVLCASLV